MWTKAFWKAATERALKTFAQALGTVLVVDGVIVEFGTVDWGRGAWVLGVITLLSYATSVGSAVATDGSPSLATEKLVTNR